MPATIRIIATGGTIDSNTYEQGKRSTFSGESYVPKMLKQSRLKTGIVFDLLMLKDSNDLTEEDRKSILERCTTSPEDRVVITHGTDTMVETARFLGSNITNKTVVLVGASIPFSQLNSDALFNLGYAIANAQQLPVGVYIAMNGKVFDWNNVRKNKEVGTFESIT